jgi:hypothetical protein
MLGVFGGFDPLIEVERDRPLGNVEDEVAVGTQVVFPPGIGLLEKIVDQPLNRIRDRQGFGDDDWVPPFDARAISMLMSRISASPPSPSTTASSICPLSA